VDKTLVRAPAPAPAQRPGCAQGAAQRCALWRSKALYQRAVAGGQGSRPSGCPGTPSRTASADQPARRWGGRVVRWRGPRAHATIVHGCAMRHTAEARPPRRPDDEKLAHEWSPKYASQLSRPRTGPCSGGDSVAAALPPRTAGQPGCVPAPQRLGNALA